MGHRREPDTSAHSRTRDSAEAATRVIVTRRIAGIPRIEMIDVPVRTDILWVLAPRFLRDDGVARGLDALAQEITRESHLLASTVPVRPELHTRLVERDCAGDPAARGYERITTPGNPPDPSRNSVLQTWMRVRSSRQPCRVEPDCGRLRAVVEVKARALCRPGDTHFSLNPHARWLTTIELQRQRECPPGHLRGQIRRLERELLHETAALERRLASRLFPLGPAYAKTTGGQRKAPRIDIPFRLFARRYSLPVNLQP